MRALWTIIGLSCIVAIPASMGSATAQTQTGTTTTTTTTRSRGATPPPLPTLDGRDPDAGPDPQAALMEARRVRTVATDRQKKIVDATARMVQLAGEVKTGVDQKNETSADVIRKTEEIEKLAHDVKQRMKG